MPRYLACGKGVGRQHARWRQGRLHLLQKFARQQVLGDVVLVEGVDQHQVVLGFGAALLAHKYARISDMAVQARIFAVAKVRARYLQHSGVQFHRVDVHFGVYCPQRGWHHAAAQPQNQHPLGRRSQIQRTEKAFGVVQHQLVRLAGTDAGLARMETAKLHAAVTLALDHQNVAVEGFFLVDGVGQRKLFALRQRGGAGQQRQPSHTPAPHPALHADTLLSAE